MATEQAFEIFRAACDSAIPFGGLTVSEWADQNRILSPEASAEPGRWRTDRVPYAREWLDTVADPRVSKVVLMTSSQVGKSEVLNNICGYFVHYDPCPIMLIQPTLDRAKDYSKKRIEPMFRDSPALAAVVAKESSRSADYTTLSKAFVGGHLLMTGANAASALASNPIRVVLADEVDRYPRDVDNEGSPLQLAVVRTRTFTNRKIVITSTPTNKGASVVEDEFESGDKRRFFVPCPHCGEFQTLVWDRVIFERDEETGLATNATYACINGCEVEENSKLKMLASGEWRAEKEFNGTVSFHISALYSVWFKWVEAANEFIIATREAKEGNPEKLKVFVNTTLGECWDAAKETADIVGLEARGEEYLAEVPLGVLCLTAGVDVQPNRLECSIIGYGAGYEAWTIQHFIIHGDPEKDEVWQQLKEVLLAEYECEREDSGGSRLTRTVDAVCIDSGGHNTQSVYNFCKSNAGYRWLAIKGASTGQKDIITKRPTRLKNGLLLFSVGTTLAKDLLFNRLKITEQGAGYYHFPDTLDAEFYRQLTAEKRVKKIKKFDKNDRYGYSNYQYKKIRDRNEVLDCFVYSLAAVEFLNPNFSALLAEENRACAPKIVEKRDVVPAPNNSFVGRHQRTANTGFISSWGKR